MIPPDEDDGKTEASLFEAISHDTRIRALFLLQNNALGFTELKHQLGIKSSGNLQHHLVKLGSLIEMHQGMYSLSDNGREAILAIKAVRRMQNRIQSDRIVITVGYAFSLYAAFMNVPFMMGTVDANTPFFALGTALIAGSIFYLLWPFAFSRWEKIGKPWELMREHPFGLLFGIYLALATAQWLGYLIGYISLEQVLIFTLVTPLVLSGVYIRETKHQMTFGRIVVVVGGGLALGFPIWIFLNYLLYVPTWAPLHEHHGPLNTVAFILATVLSYCGAAYLMDRLGRRRNYSPFI